MRKKNGYRFRKFLISLIPNKSIKQYFYNKLPKIWECMVYSDEEINNLKKNILRYPKLYTPEETLDKIINNNLSFSRIGDGEFNLCIKEGNVFNKYDEKLAQKLINIIRAGSTDKCLVCLNNYEPDPCLKRWFVYHGVLYLDRVLNAINFKKDGYGDAYFLLSIMKNGNVQDVKRIKTLWGKKKVVFVCNNTSLVITDKLNIFENIVQKEFVYVPSHEAFSLYEDILQKITQFPKDYVIYLECGPLASVLAYELSAIGYRALDMGDFYKRIVMRNVTWRGECQKNI